MHSAEQLSIFPQTAPKLGNNTVEVRFSGTEAGICCSKPMGELLYLMRYWVVSPGRRASMTPETPRASSPAARTKPFDLLCPAATNILLIHGGARGDVALPIISNAL